jgi:large subunit ribosomal protein L9
MQVILLENIINLGKIGDQVEVKDGFGRNFLLKLGKALRANKENIEYVKQKKDELNKKNQEIKKEFTVLAEKINNKKISISKETKENGDLYANIKPKEISLLIEKDLKTKINPSNIQLKKEINTIGSYVVEINLHAEVSAKLSIIVKKIENEKK